MKIISKIMLSAFVFFVLSSATLAREKTMGANMMSPILVSVEKGLIVNFGTAGTDTYVVDPSGESDIGHPALIRISGNPVEVMIHVERDTISGDATENLQGLKISEFNVLQQGAGSSVGLMPFSDEDSFLLTIGGKVTGSSEFIERYTGVNILSVNYL